MAETTWTPEQLAERAQCIAEVCPRCARGEPLHTMRTSGGIDQPRELLELHHSDPSDEAGCVQCPAAGIHLRVHGAPPGFTGRVVPCPPSRSEVYRFRALQDALRPFGTCTGALAAADPEQQRQLDATPLLVRYPSGALYELTVTSGDLRRAREALDDLARRAARLVEQMVG